MRSASLVATTAVDAGYDPARSRPIAPGRANCQSGKRVGPVSADQAAGIPLYLMGGGLQMIAKRVRARRPDIGMLPEVQWISANHKALTDVIQRAIRR